MIIKFIKLLKVTTFSHFYSPFLTLLDSLDSVRMPQKIGHSLAVILGAQLLVILSRCLTNLKAGWEIRSKKKNIQEGIVRPGGHPGSLEPNQIRATQTPPPPECRAAAPSERVGGRSSITNHRASVCSRSICILVALFDPPGVLMFHQGKKGNSEVFKFSPFFHFGNSWSFYSKHGDVIDSVSRADHLIPDKQCDWMRGWDITPPQECRQALISGLSRLMSLYSRPSLLHQQLGGSKQLIGWCQLHLFTWETRKSWLANWVQFIKSW